MHPEYSTEFSLSSVETAPCAICTGIPSVLAEAPISTLPPHTATERGITRRWSSRWTRSRCISMGSWWIQQQIPVCSIPVTHLEWSWASLTMRELLAGSSQAQWTTSVSTTGRCQRKRFRPLWKPSHGPMPGDPFLLMGLCIRIHG